MRGEAGQRAAWLRTRYEAAVKLLSRASVFYENQADSFANRPQSNLKHAVLNLRQTFWIIFREFG